MSQSYGDSGTKGYKQAVLVLKVAHQYLGNINTKIILIVHLELKLNW